MAYLTHRDLAALVGERDLAAAAPPAPGAQEAYDSGDVTARIEAASDWVDDLLRNRYPVPLADPPGWLVDGVGHIAHRALCDGASITDVIRERARRAEKRLRDVAAGTASLPRAAAGARSPRLVAPARRPDWRGVI